MSAKIRLFAGAAALVAMVLMTGCPENPPPPAPPPATGNHPAPAPPASTNNK